VQKIKHFLVAFQNFLTVQCVTLGYKKRRNSSDLVRLGSDYGGWWIPDSVLANTQISRIAISAGLGFDVSFDEQLLENGIAVIGLDPLPESVRYADSTLGHFSGFRSLEKGLWVESGHQSFFPPKNLKHDSWSITNVQDSSHSMSMSFEVISLQELFQQFPALQNSDYRILKMDIEGSELELIRNLLSFPYTFNLLAVEMDFLSLIPFLSFKRRYRMAIEARKLLKSLDSKGYTLRAIENFNFFWLHETP
jgi:FkbM family methyltransferase